MDDMKQQLKQIHIAAAQVIRAGDEEQVRRAAQALAAFRELPGKVSTGLALQNLGTGGEANADGTIMEEVKRASHLKRVLTEKVKGEPESAGKLIQAWMHEKDKTK